jgi:pimeloyl-ACP methyl ester carboxylesterase
MLWEQCARVEALSSAPIPGRLVDVGGRRLHLDCRGHGAPTVVLEAGLDGYGALSWAPVHDQLARRTRTCAYSRRGVMWSEPASGPVDARSIARDLRRLLQLAGEPGPYVLTAHSVGALYALTFVAEFDADVSGLVLVDPTHPDQLEALRPIAPALATPLPPLLRTLGLFDWTGAPRLLFSLAPSPAPKQAHVTRRSAAFAATSLAAVVREADAIETSARLARDGRTLGSRPLIVLSAGRVITSEVAAALGLDSDRATRVTQRMHQLHADAAGWSTMGRLERIDDGGHYLHFDHPERVLAAVDRVVDAARARPPR